MENFKSIINKYVKMTSNQNDKRIMQEALNLIDSESTILENEFDILNKMRDARNLLAHRYSIEFDKLKEVKLI